MTATKPKISSTQETKQPVCIVAYRNLPLIGLVLAGLSPVALICLKVAQVWVEWNIRNPGLPRRLPAVIGDGLLLRVTNVSFIFSVLVLWAAYYVFRAIDNVVTAYDALRQRKRWKAIPIIQMTLARLLNVFLAWTLMGYWGISIYMDHVRDRKETFFYETTDPVLLSNLYVLSQVKRIQFIEGLVNWLVIMTGYFFVVYGFLLVRPIKLACKAGQRKMAACAAHKLIRASLLAPVTILGIATVILLLRQVEIPTPGPALRLIVGNGFLWWLPCLTLFGYAVISWFSERKYLFRLFDNPSKWNDDSLDQEQP